MITCRSCGREKPDLKRLWDDHLYCESCIRSHCPGILAHAELPAALVEDIPSQLWRFPINVVGSMVRGLAILSVPYLIALLFVIPREGVLIQTLIGATAIFFVAAVLAVGLLTAGRCPRRMSVAGGRLTIETRFSEHVYDLSEITWAVGPASHDPSFIGLPFWPKPDAVLVFESDRAVMAWRCGMTDDMAQMWKGFFLLSNVKRRKLGFRERLMEEFSVSSH